MYKIKRIRKRTGTLKLMTYVKYELTFIWSRVLVLRDRLEQSVAIPEARDRSEDAGHE